MARFLCQLCYTVVHYGERHPCFIFKSDEDFYAIPLLDDTKGTDVTHEKDENRIENLNRNSEEIITETEEKDVEIPQQVTSRFTENKEQMSLISSSKRKRTRKTGYIPAKISETDDCAIHETDGITGGRRNLSIPEATLMAGPSGVNTRSPRKGPEKLFIFYACCEIFNKKGDFEKHYRTHTGEERNERGESGEKFVLKSTLQDRKRTHTGAKTYQCSLCGREFAHKSTLKNHFRRHTGEKPYKCKVCGKAYASAGALGGHYRTKHAKGDLPS